MKFRKMMAGVMALAMMLGMFSAGMAISADARTAESLEEIPPVELNKPINITIDRKTVTPEEAMNGVFIYVKADNPMWNASEFGIKLDEQYGNWDIEVSGSYWGSRWDFSDSSDCCVCDVITSVESLQKYPSEAENSLDVTYTLSDVTNFVWCCYASMSPKSKFIESYLDESFESMNLLVLHIAIPEKYATAGAHFDIEYQDTGINGYKTEVWRNDYTDVWKITKDEFVYFERKNYVETGLVNVQNGWIEIESEGNEPTTEEMTDPPTESPASYAKGDIDGDGAINIVDVLTLNQYLLGIGEILPERVNLGDVNNDGIVNDADAMTILKSLVGLAKIS